MSISTAALATAYETLRAQPDPYDLTVDQPVYILPTEYGWDSMGMDGLEMGNVVTVGSEGNYLVDWESYGELWVHAQRVRAAA